MRPSSRPPGTPSRLSDSLRHRLNTYGLAASAAGVGVVALVPSAEAKIVYTKTHKVIGYDGSYDLDLNHDGISDFIIQQRHFCNSTTCTVFHRSLFVEVPAENGVVGNIRYGNNTNLHYAAALKAGAGIGPNRRFIGSGGYNPGVSMVKGWGGGGHQYTSGKWVNVNNRYLGLKFKIKENFHYGWARLNVRIEGRNITATLTGYAYETIPNKPIIAGKTKGPDKDSTTAKADFATVAVPAFQPVTLGLLALGSPALSIWRRKESVGATQ